MGELVLKRWPTTEIDSDHPGRAAWLKVGLEVRQLHRMLNVTYKSAWFMAHRIRYAMTLGPLVDLMTGMVEEDEAYIGGKESNKHKDKWVEGTQGRITKIKTPVAALVGRD